MGGKRIKIGNLIQKRLRKVDLKKCQTEEIDYIDLSSIASTGSRIVSRRIKVSEAPSRAQQIVESGDILVSNVRPNLRSFSIVRESPSDVPLVASFGYTILRPKQCKDELIGITCIPVPSLSEQVSIIHILEMNDESHLKHKATLSSLIRLKTALSQKIFN